MIGKVIHNFVKFIEEQFKVYDIDMNSKYNSDINNISEYSSSLRLRKLFKDDIDNIISPDDIKNLKKQNYVLMLYNFNAIEKDQEAFNNINLEAVFLPSESSPFTYDRTEKTDIDTDLIHYIRSVNEYCSQEDLTVRDVIYGRIPFDFKIIVNDIDLAYNLQMAYLSKLVNERSFGISIKFASYQEPLDITYKLKLNNISNFSQIDPIKYGNLWQIDFNGTLEGYFLSVYSKKIKGLCNIDVTLKVCNDLENC